MNFKTMLPKAMTNVTIAVYDILSIVWTTKFTFLVEIRKVILSLFRQEKRTEALLESNLLGYPDPIE